MGVYLSTLGALVITMGPSTTGDTNWLRSIGISFRRQQRLVDSCWRCVCLHGTLPAWQGCTVTFYFPKPRGTRREILASRPICPSHYHRSAPSPCQAPVDSSWINKWKTGQSGHGGQEERLLQEAALSRLGMEVNTTMGGVSKSAALGFYPHLHPFMFSTPTLLLDAEKTLSS